MILSDQEIRRALKELRLIIDSLPDDGSIQTTAVDLTLGSRFTSWDEGLINQKGVDLTLIYGEVNVAKLTTYSKEAKLQADGSFVLPPRGFVLA